VLLHGYLALAAKDDQKNRDLPGGIAMNILMAHPHDIHSSLEPWTVRIVYIAREFVKKGHRVKLVYFPLKPEKRAAYILEEGIEAIPLSRRLGPHRFIRNVFKIYKMAAWVDILHFQKCFYHASIPVIIAGLLRGKPVHYDWDDWELKIFEVSTEGGALRNCLRFFISLLEKTLPKICDTVSVASERLKKECLRLGVDENRVFESHVGADLSRFHPEVSGDMVLRKHSIRKPLVLYLGQLHGGQYADLFIKAAGKIRSEFNHDVQFMIVGDGYMAGELKKRCGELNLEESIIFVGAVPHDDVPRYIAAADVCVACFERNDVTMCKSPLKIVEYLASGKAIVASEVGEVPRMLKGAGILVAPGDGASLAGGISRILNDNNLKLQLEKSARLRAEEKYNWKVTAEHILSAYQMAINHHV
jgi:glycosyltransferase involved in cell wall biosynthesis